MLAQVDPAIVKAIEDKLEHRLPFPCIEDSLKIDSLYCRHARDLSALTDITVLLGPREYELEEGEKPEHIDLLHIRHLHLEGVELTDIKVVSKLRRLITFEAEYSSVKDISPLAQCKNISTVSLKCSLVEDISPLLELPHLDDLNLRGAPLSDESFYKHLPTLRKRIDVRFFKVPTEEEWRLNRALHGRGLRASFYFIRDESFITSPGLKHTDSPESDALWRMKPEVLREHLKNPDLTVEDLISPRGRRTIPLSTPDNPVPLMKRFEAVFELPRSLDTWKRLCALTEEAEYTLSPEEIEDVIARGLEHLDGLSDELRLAPVRWIERMIAGENLSWWPWVRAVGVQRQVLGTLCGLRRTIELATRDPGDGIAAFLSQRPEMANVHILSIQNHALTDGGVDALAESPYFGELRRLLLMGNEITDAGVQMIAQSPRFEHLETLLLMDNKISDVGAKAIAESPTLRRLEVLNLNKNKVGDEGVKALAYSENCAALQFLYLNENEIQHSGATALANSKQLGELKTLGLYSNKIGDEGIASIAESVALVGLEQLMVDDNQIGDIGATALIEGPLIQRLKLLSLCDNDFQDSAKLTETAEIHGVKLRV